MSSSKDCTARPIHLKHMVASLTPEGTFSPKIVRIIEAFGPASADDNKQADFVFESVLKRLQSEKAYSRSQFLITCGGFLRCAWPAELKIHKPSDPDVEDVKKLRLQAKQTGDKFLRPFLPRIRKVSRWITLGIDCKSGTGQAAELIYIRDLDTNSVAITGKSYPTAKQECRLVRFPMNSHFVKAGREILILGCHDLNLFSNRALKNTKVGSARRGWINEMMREVRQREFPDVVLHHPHKTDTAKSWSTAWSGMLQRAKPKPNSFASSGRWYSPDGRPRMDLKNCLKRMSSADVLTVVVRTKTKEKRRS